MPGLYDLAAHLRRFAEGAVTRAELERWLEPVLGADPLDVTASPSAPWDESPDEERLYWRLLYLVETSALDDAALAALLQRVLACLADTNHPGDTLELLPLLRDQPRFCGIVAKHVTGVISRAGFLGVIANSGYPAHAKLWLEHAPPAALVGFCRQLEAGAYEEAARTLERPPG